jgi:hypothetical protein
LKIGCVYILYDWKLKKNHKYDKTMFKIYLNILIIKNNFNQILQKNLLLVLLFLYELHNNWKKLLKIKYKNYNSI